MKVVGNAQPSSTQGATSKESAAAPASAAGAPVSSAAAQKVWGATGAQGTRKPAPIDAQGTAGGFQSAAFEARLDSDTRSRATRGNTVTPLFDGVASFRERERLIAGAKHSVCLQTFIFSSDDTGWSLAKQLAEKARAGVKVRVIYDAIGSARADPKMFEMMKAAGVELRPYGEAWKVWDLNDRWHEKNLLVDGQVSVLGGMNVADEYALGGSGKQVLSRQRISSEPWRDTDVKIEGPAVRDSMSAFVRNWNELGPPLSNDEQHRLFPPLVAREGGPSVRVVQQNPEVKGLEQTTTKLYLRSIEAARKSITIENAYFLPPPEVRRALIAAARRGVDVKVMTNSREANDLAFVSDAARFFYDELIAAGVKIYEKHGGTLHSKTAAFDGEYSIIGSTNLNGRSRNADTEIVMASDDKSTARALEDRFATGLKQTHRVTAAELGRESMWTNVKQWALSTMAWTF